MELNDLIALKNLGKEGLSPYEQVKLDYMSSKHRTSGTAIAGLVLGTVGAAVGVGAWIFGPAYANAKSNQAKEAANSAKELAAVQIAASQRQIDQLTSLFASERQERIAGDLNITTTINDTVSGSQQGTLTQSQQLSNELTLGLMTGRYSENPQRVALYQDAKPCPCPVGGCGCNG
ncbi:MAG: hypothetical protein IJ698_00270 [Prevotella sp.]|nr:hypothetical protein [Prevotella sp.]